MGEKRVLEFPLSEKGIKDAIDFLEQYKSSIQSKAERLVERLAEIGVEEAGRRFDEANYNGETDTSHVPHISDISFDGDNVTVDITLESKEIIFIEFGAGIFHNPGKLGQSAHASKKFAKKFPVEYKIGKYGKDGTKEYSRGKNKGWVHDGKFTHGTKATMPMYGAEMAVIENIRMVAKEVFAEQ